MPYNRAQRILGNFKTVQAGLTESQWGQVGQGGFGAMMGVDQPFNSPERTAAQWSQPPQPTVAETVDPSSQPPEGAGAAGRTDLQQDAYPPESPGSAPGPAVNPAQTTAPVGGRFNQSEVLRNNPYSSGVQQSGVNRPLSQARRFGI